MDYARLTLPEVRAALDAIAREAETIFGGLDAPQLNWRPDETRWSVGQCFDHLLTANRMTLRAADEALTGATSTVWQRMPFLPRLLGPALVRSQAPETTRKYKAPASARPTASAVAPGVIQRFAGQQQDTVKWVDTFGENEATRVIMLSPFIRVIAYSVLDGCRLLVAHDHRHFEQARRVLAASGFPRTAHPTKV